METEKNPKVDLVKNSAPYFAIGLCLVFVTEIGRVQNLREKCMDFGKLNVDNDEIEDVPLTEQLKTPSPPRLLL